MESNLRTNFDSKEYYNSSNFLKKDEMLKKGVSDFTKVVNKSDSINSGENTIKEESFKSVNSNKFVPVISNQADNSKNLVPTNIANSNINSSNNVSNIHGINRNRYDKDNEKPKKFIQKLYSLINVRIFNLG